MMAGKSWRFACLFSWLLVVETAAAQAQHEPTSAGPAQTSTVPAPPQQASPAQPAPPQTSPAETSAGQGPYVPAPVLAPGTIAVPAYPGAAPAVFASAAEFVDYGSWRLKQLSARERALIVLGRPENYQAQRAGGFALVAGGSALALGCFSFYFLSGSALPHSGEDDLDDGAGIGLLSGFLFGAGLAIGGAVWLKRLKRDNPYREEINGLHLERARLGQDIKRARKQARVEQRRMSFDFTRLRVTF